MGSLRVCTRCVSDTTIPGIRFDDQGVCQFCRIHDELEKRFPRGEMGQQLLSRLVDRIRTKGRNQRYDCVVGVSGGRDSTYALYTAVNLGLRPLAVHFDNGWDSEIGVNNIKNALTRLEVDLYTHVADWEEFKDLQLAFLRASVSDAEIPTDVAIFGTLHQAAVREGIQYIINGHSFRTEGVAPIGWTYMDGKYINSVHKQFGCRPKPKTVPNFTLRDLLYNIVVKRIRTVTLLNYVEYDQEEVGEMLEKEVGWTYYGGHHHESHYTHFVQSFLLPQKFGIDKRKIEYSALVRSGQMGRDEALKEISEDTYPYDEELVSHTINKLRLAPADFEAIMTAQPKTFHDYQTYYPIMKAMRLPIKVACSIGLLPNLLYQKYLA